MLQAFCAYALLDFQSRFCIILSMHPRSPNVIASNTNQQLIGPMCLLKVSFRRVKCYMKLVFVFSTLARFCSAWTDMG